ncbi:MAG: amidohydrolase family protein [Acidobacteria bacterium]|nr:amidohydrolase family protein [Acidobacteriota bacterium]
MNRRTFLSVAAGIAVEAAGQPGPSIPIIDTHIHLFDPTRPQGVPWPPKTNTIVYRPALPDRYRNLTKTLGIKGAIEVECSPWLEDNQWVLDVAAKDTIIVGTVGNLEPGKPDFRRQLERFHKNSLFRGIRYGYLWDRNLGDELAKAEFISGLRELAAAGLALDTANASQRLLSDVVRLTDQVPDLRVVIDHLPSMDPPQEEAARATHRATLRELGKRPQVYVKVSEVLRRSGGRVPYELSFYRSRLDEIWETFGSNRLLYGSDWPNSDPLGTYSQVLNVVREYFSGKGPEAAEKFFWKNSVAAYHWVKREAGQPALDRG